MKELCLVIPTHNRPLSVMSYLNALRSDRVAELNVDIIIYDSSSDNATEDIAREYINSGDGRVLYRRYDGEVDLKSIDVKIFCAAREFCEEYKYVWFSSDGTIQKVGFVYDAIRVFTEKGYDLLVIDNTGLLRENYREYSNCAELFHDCAWRMTSLSSTVVSGDLLKRIIRDYPATEIVERHFWIPMSYFKHISKNAFRAACIPAKGACSTNPHYTDSFWSKSGNALWQWSEEWCEAIWKLPDIYDGEKAYVLKSHDKYTGIFSIKSLVHMRANGNITFQKIGLYKAYLPHVTKTHVIAFYLVALFFNKPVTMICKRVYNMVESFGARVRHRS